MKDIMVEVHNLKVNAGEKPILDGVTMTIRAGEMHVIMGPNGSGKSTFAHTLMGNPKFGVLSGEMRYKGKDISGLEPDKRASLGMFMAFQYPKEIAGVQLDRFLYTAYKTIHSVKNPQEPMLSVFAFHEKLTEEMKRLGINPEFSSRSLNVGFSGGEKKKAEMLQLMVLEPDFAILDETDSGLDVDALKIVGDAVNRFRNSTRCVLVVTHYNRILQYLKPDFVHVMIKGRIVESGGAGLAEKLEKEGYGPYLKSA